RRSQPAKVATNPMILLIVIFVCRPLSWIRPPNVSRSPAPSERSERGHRVARERRAASGAARCYAAYHCSQIAARCRPPRATLVVNWLTTNRLLPLDVFLRKLCDTERPETLRSPHRHIHDRRQQVVLRFGGEFRQSVLKLEEALRILLPGRAKGADMLARP